MSVEQNKAVVHRFVEEVVNGGKLDVLDEVISAEYVDHAPDPGQAPGREGLRQALAALRRAFPDFHSTHQRMIAEGDLVAYHEVSRGTHRAEFHGIQATGRPIEIGEMHFVRLAGGKIVEHWALYDTLTMMRQLGAFPEPTEGTG